MRGAWAVALSLALTGCGGPPAPVEVDTRHDSCAWCRMGVVDARLAAQLVASLEEPKLFDDIGCLRDYLRSNATVPPGATAYVADHRTAEWVPARQAVYVQTPALVTPMSSGIAAWSDATSRSQDPRVPDAPLRSAAEILGDVP